MGCLCESVAVGGRRATAARHSAELLSRPKPCSSSIWKAARFSSLLGLGGMSFTKWMGLSSGQLRQSESIMTQDKWAHSITFHCRGLFSAGPFACLQDMAWVKQDNKHAWNSLWTFWTAITNTVWLKSWLDVMTSCLPTSSVFGGSPSLLISDIFMRLVSENPAKQATQLLITWGEISRLTYFTH